MTAAIEELTEKCDYFRDQLLETSEALATSTYENELLTLDLELADEALGQLDDEYEKVYSEDITTYSFSYPLASSRAGLSSTAVICCSSREALNVCCLCCG